MTKAKTPEGQIKQQVVKLLEATGWFVKNIYTGGKFANRSKGFADLFAIKNGRILLLEIKTEKAKQRPEQIKFEEEIKAHGGEYYVVRSVDDLISRF